jgi:hypothetical protein
MRNPYAAMKFLNHWRDSTLALSATGATQEQTTTLGMPGITLSDNAKLIQVVREHQSQRFAGKNLS